MTQIKEALQALETAFETNKGNRYAFDIGNLWGLDSRTDEAITALGIAAGKHFETIRHCLEHYEKMRWQPIESAPEDGSYFVAWCTQVGCQDIKTRPLVTRIIDGMFEGLMFYDDPTHWMPLPNPPEEKP